MVKETFKTADYAVVNVNTENNWQREIQFRLDLLRMATAADQRSPEEVEQAELLAQLARTAEPPARD